MSKQMSSYGGREGGIGGLVGGIFMRGNKSIFLRHSTLRSLLYTYTHIHIYVYMCG